jgi:hypothetical protein
MDSIAKQIISWIAVRELGYSGAVVALYLGVTNSYIPRIVSSGKKPDMKDYIRDLGTFCRNASLSYRYKAFYDYPLAL